jgi:hypothetical protein
MQAAIKFGTKSISVAIPAAGQAVLNITYSQKISFVLPRF